MHNIISTGFTFFSSKCILVLFGSSYIITFSIGKVALTLLMQSPCLCIRLVITDCLVVTDHKVVVFFSIILEYTVLRN